MAVVHKNKTKQEIQNIMVDVCQNKVYAECSVCKLFIVEENSGDGDVYTEMAKECTC